MKQRFFSTAMLLLSFIMLWAQPKDGYYDRAEGKSSEGLRSALFDIISKHTNVGYDGLWKVYRESDITDDGKIWDMYSTCDWTFGNKQCGNYKVVCDCYNREHSVPQSWFKEASPMVADAFHVYPTDGKVNGQRSNYPFGECANGVSESGGKALGKLGTSTFPGYTGKVFEPVDEYKGDFARSYFYMSTCYKDKNFTSGTGGQVFQNGAELKKWTVDLFLKWHRQDPVSKKETDRNNAVEKHQKNRNPFIDYPDLAEYIWGSKKGEPWSSTTTGINETSVNFTLAQNPVHDVIDLRTNESEVAYMLFSVDGRMLISGSFTGTTSIDVAGLQGGIYLLQLQSGLKKTIEKVVVE